MPTPATVQDRQAQMLRLREACMEFVAPADLIAYSEEPEFVKAHQRGVGGYKFMRISAPTPRPYNCDIVYLPVKSCDELAMASQETGAPAISALQPLLLVHGLRVRDGERYLVTLEMPPWYGNTLVFVAYMRELGSGVAGEAPKVHEQVVNVPIVFVPVLEGKGLRVYSAQYDEKDPSRFTIAYAVDGVRGTIRGSLVKDLSPQLRIEVVDGPLKKP